MFSDVENISFDVFVRAPAGSDPQTGDGPERPGPRDEIDKITGQLSLVG